MYRDIWESAMKGRTSLDTPTFAEECRSECNEADIFLFFSFSFSFLLLVSLLIFLGACYYTDSLIPLGTYYCIYINSDLLNFVRTSRRRQTI